MDDFLLTGQYLGIEAISIMKGSQGPSLLLTTSSFH